MNDASGPRRPTEPDGGWVEVDLPFPGVRQFEEEFAPNLANDGLFIPTPEPLPPSTVVRFHVTLPDEFVLLEGTGVVVWARPPGDPSGAPPGMSLRFATLSQHYQDLLDRIVQTHVEHGGTPFEVEPRLGVEGGDDGIEPVPSPASRGVASERPRLTVRRAGAPVTTASDDRTDRMDELPFDVTGPLDRTISLEPREAPDPDGVESPGTAPVATAEPPAAPAPAESERPEGSAVGDDGPDVPAHWPPWEPSTGPELRAVEPDPGAGGGPPNAGHLPDRLPETVYPDEVSRQIPEELFSDDLDVEREPPEPAMQADTEIAWSEQTPAAEAEATIPARRRWSMGRTIATAVAAVVVIGIVAVLVLSPWSRLVDEQDPAEPESVLVDGDGDRTDHVVAAAVVAPPGQGSVPNPVGVEQPVDAAGTTAGPEPTSPVVTEPSADAEPASRIEEIRWSEDGRSTTIQVRGNGVLLPERVALIPMASPSRLLIRIRQIESRYESYVIDVDSPHVTAIRTGLHPELSPPALYVVADLASDDVTVIDRRFDGPSLSVTVGR